MRRYVILLFVWFLVSLASVHAQDGLNLPTELYILLNEGVVQRYGLGASGVETVVGADDTFVLDFAVAPDSNWIAYRTQEGLYIKDMYTSRLPEQQQIEGTTASYPDIRGAGETLTWSSDSQVIAYTTFGNGRVYFRENSTFQDLGVSGLQDLVWSPEGRYLAAGATGHVWWIFAREGTVLRLTSVITDATAIAWLPNGLIYFTPSTGGVSLMDLTAGNAQTVILDSTTVYFLPFVKAPYLYVLKGIATQARLMRLSDSGGKIISEDLGTGDVDTSHLRWAPDGSFLTAFSGGALALVDPISGEGFTLPINSASAYGWGAYRPNTVGLTLPSNGYYVAETFSTGVAQVWKIPTDGTLPETITLAEKGITEFALSPDNQKIAYVSGGKLWYYVLGGTSDQLYDLTDLAEDTLTTPAFSPDGKRLYYRDQQNDQRGIWYANLDTGETFPFLLETDVALYVQPQPAPSVSAMLVNVTFEGQTVILVDTNTAEEIQLGTFGMGKWLKNANLGLVGVPTGSDQYGLYIQNASDTTQAPVLALALQPNQRVIDFVQTNDTTVRLLVQGALPSVIQVVDASLVGGTGTIVGSVGYFIDPKLSPDGAFVGGYTHPNGALVLQRIADNVASIENVGNGLMGFVWK